MQMTDVALWFWKNCEKWQWEITPQRKQRRFFGAVLAFSILFSRGNIILLPDMVRGAGHCPARMAETYHNQWPCRHAPACAGCRGTTKHTDKDKQKDGS
ncbi:hypothetical protein TMES_15645 [Thalassospira mesophila]|uniref:Uncharacterized protein n=1 Tax=Thalassospira mesophila TaxID=1293891 RepID=A0A1Y2KXV1_9PROT|nr:hypothetical protein TMES_15645 [Thalassospira mesophila]